MLPYALHQCYNFALLAYHVTFYVPTRMNMRNVVVNDFMTDTQASKAEAARDYNMFGKGFD